MSEFNVLNGSCLCQAIKYKVYREPYQVANCHCIICQKQHGALFGTYFSIKKEDFEYTKGQENLVCFNSSENTQRKFCGICGSNIEWNSNEKFPGWISLTLSTLDTVYCPKKIEDHFHEQKVCWSKSN